MDPSQLLPDELGNASEVSTAAGSNNFSDRVSNDPDIIRPDFLTMGGNSQLPFVLDGNEYRSLEEFESLDDLGRALGMEYHGSVHGNLGGTMASFDSPADPAFYSWHGEVDGVVSEWLETKNGQTWASNNPGTAAMWASNTPHNASMWHGI